MTSLPLVSSDLAWCVRHGGVEPVGSRTCPDCPESGVVGSVAQLGPGVGCGGGGVVPRLEFDPDALGQIANRAAARTEALRAVLASAGAGLADVRGELLTVAALRSCAVARLTDATALADRFGAVATKLTESVTAYVRLDDDLAALLNAICPGTE